MLRLLPIFLLLFLAPDLSAQKKEEAQIIAKDSVASNSNEIDPLAPARAAFYSAIFPGMGQLYNKKYWKMPVVYAAIGTSVYFYVWNDERYRQFRDVYKRRLAGYSDDSYPFLSDDRVISAQKFYQKNRDLSLLISVGLYVLNIIDANVDAHLQQFNVDDNLTLLPGYFPIDCNNRRYAGLTLNYTF